MGKRGIVVASFGTTHTDTLENSIAAVERRVAEAFPEAACVRAFTSGMCRRGLEKKGITVPDVPGALDALKAQGVTDAVILPTHIICGDEYDKLIAFADEAEGFSSIITARPLMTTYDDVREILTVLDGELKRDEGEAVVLMGHGSGHWCNTIYAAADYYAKANGFADFYIGTVEAWPDLDAVAGSLAKDGRRSVLLAPLMLVAGDHAKNDMAGDWADRFKSEGVSVRTLLRGLGEYEGIRDMYVRRVKQALGRG